MKYAEINNNTIIKIHNELPTAWKNISNFHALSDLELSDLSWSDNNGFKFYPVSEDARPDLDTRLYNISNVQYVIDNQSKTVHGSYNTTAKSDEIAWEVIRKIRNNKLYSCDWTQLPDVPIDGQAKSNWSSYRQLLRDITNQTDPFNITWPTEPAT